MLRVRLKKKGKYLPGTDGAQIDGFFDNFKIIRCIRSGYWAVKRPAVLVLHHVVQQLLQGRGVVHVEQLGVHGAAALVARGGKAAVARQPLFFQLFGTL